MRRPADEVYADRPAVALAEHEVVIGNQMGLHARPAAQFVAVANQFVSEIVLSKDGREVNGKSIIQIISLGAAHGNVLTIRAVGDDAERAAAELAGLLGESSRK